MPDGRVIRPTLVLLDDVQDRGTAKSALQTRDTIEVIDGDVAGMGEAGTNLPMLMSGNCIETTDVMSHYLESDRWQSIRIPSVEQWPKGWKDGEGETFDLWREWLALYQPGKGAATFYRKNKAKMTAGMRLSAPGTFRKEKNIPDPFCAVMVKYFKMGPEAFHAEDQQKPLEKTITLYTFTPEVVKSRIDPARKPGIVPDAARVVIAATDINISYAISTNIVAFEGNQTGAVLWYGLFKTAPMPVPPKATERETREIVYQALAIHGRQLAALPCRPQSQSGPAWFIDGGGTPEGEVIRFCFNSQQICGVQAVTCFGRGWKQYRPVAKKEYRVKVGEQLHLVTQRRDRQWILYNTDYWREIMQRGFVSDPGAPGSCTLPAGSHGDFAHQVTREPLIKKGEGLSGQTEWIYAKTNEVHDYGDCMHMAYMGAAFNGIGGGVTSPAKRVYRETRRPKVGMEL
jgi:hypothetical protein